AGRDRAGNAGTVGDAATDHDPAVEELTHGRDECESAQMTRVSAGARGNACKAVDASGCSFAREVQVDDVRKDQPTVIVHDLHCGLRRAERRDYDRRLVTPHELEIIGKA